MKIHQLNGYIQAIYLVEYKHGLLLLDGCCRCDVKTVCNFISRELKRPITELKTVVVTHMHPDHAGGAHLFRKITGCQIVSANKMTHWYRGLNGLLMHWIDMILSIYVGKRIKQGVRNVYYSRKLKADIKLKDGDNIPGFEDWSVIATPGHTDRDLSVLHKSKNWMYVADLIIKLKNKKFIAPFPVFHPNKYKNSLNHVKNLAPRQVLLAHGGMVQITDNEYVLMVENAPRVPRTPLRATIKKFKKITRRH
jgi:glyoxylase-like metal-dependent hydrolase (beta-lactamase superfamily II)